MEPQREDKDRTTVTRHQKNLVNKSRLAGDERVPTEVKTILSEREGCIYAMSREELSKTAAEEQPSLTRKISWPSWLRRPTVILILSF